MALSITKATVGGSEDTWGTTTNTALDAIVSEINNNADGTNAITPNMTSFQVGGTAVTSTADELNKLDGATVTTDEINILDGDTSATSTTIADADRIILNDNGTMVQVAVTDLSSYINASAGSGSVTSVGLSAPTGLTVSGSPVTTTGTLALTFTSGYSIPTTASQSNWNTAYGWGDHASAGYITTVSAGTGISVSTSGSTVTVSASSTGISSVFSNSATFSSTRLENLGSSTQDRLYIGTYTDNLSRTGTWSTSSGSSGAFFKSHTGGVHRIAAPSGGNFTMGGNSDSTAQFWLYLPAGVTVGTTSGTNQTFYATGVYIEIG